MSRIEGAEIFRVEYPWGETGLVAARYKCGKCLCVLKATAVNVLTLLYMRGVYDQLFIILVINAILWMPKNEVL